MAIRFTRRGAKGRRLGKRLDHGMREARRLAVGYGGAAGDGSFDLLGFAIRAFELAPTEDIDQLISHGVDGSDFFLNELRPNWHELTREQRATKIASFVRFANVLDASADPADPVDGASERLADLRATVRTKIVLLASAYDEEYRDSFSRRIARDPLSFGDYELTRA